MNANKARIGANIRQMRATTGISQVELSEKTGIGQEYISRLENGVYMPRIDTLIKIAKAIGCDLTELI